MSSPINVSYITPNAILAVSIIFPIFSVLIVSLRFYVRRVQNARLLGDDWLLLPALVQRQSAFWQEPITDIT